MKKLLSLIMALVLLLLLVGCSDKTDGDADPTDTLPTTDTAAPEPDIDEPKDLYGIFDERFVFAFENVLFMKGTFTGASDAYTKHNEYVDGYSMADLDSASKRPPLLYHLIKEYEAGKTELYKYFLSLVDNNNIAKLPDDAVLETLAGDDVAAVMSIAAHPAALAKGERTFSLRMLLESDVSAFGVTDDEIKATVERAIAHYGKEELFDESRLSGSMKTKLAALGFDINAPEKAEGSLCSEHADAYHTIPEELVNLVGASEHEKWEKSAKKEKGCDAGGYNIFAFVKNFEVSAEAIIKIYNSEGGTLGDYPVELICAGDAAAVEAYYSVQNKEAEREVAANRAMAALKSKVISDNAMDGFFMSVHECSLPELLFMINYDAAYIEELETYIKSLGADLSIDFDRIYESKDTFMKMIMKRTPYYIDCTASGRTSFDTPYEARALFEG